MGGVENRGYVPAQNESMNSIQSRRAAVLSLDADGLSRGAISQMRIARRRGRGIFNAVAGVLRGSSPIGAPPPAWGRQVTSSARSKRRLHALSRAAAVYTVPLRQRFAAGGRVAIPTGRANPASKKGAEEKGVVPFFRRLLPEKGVRPFFPDATGGPRAGTPASAASFRQSTGICRRRDRDPRDYMGAAISRADRGMLLGVCRVALVLARGHVQPGVVPRLRRRQGIGVSMRSGGLGRHPR